MILNFSVFLFSSIFVIALISIIPFSEGSTEIKAHDDSFKITKTSVTWDTKFSDTITISNLGDEEAEINMRFAKPQLVSHSGLSGTPDFLLIEESSSINGFNISPSLNDFKIKPGETKKIKFTIEFESDRTATYSTTFWLYGDNFDSIPIKLEIKVIQNQFLFLFCAMLGMFVAMLIGLFETMPKKQDLESKLEASENKELVYTNFASISSDELITLKYFGRLKSNNKIKIDASKDIRTYILSRLTLGLIAVSVTLPSALFGNEYFIGIPIIDLISAGVIGFVIYRTQDLKKLFRGDKSND